MGGRSTGCITPPDGVYCKSASRPRTSSAPAQVLACSVNPCSSTERGALTDKPGLPPPPPVAGRAYEASGAPPLPRTLRAANEALAASERARQLLGEAFVDHYVRTRDWEVRQYERAVTDWELERTFEAT